MDLSKPSGKVDHLMGSLQLEEIMDQQIRSLSQGDVRKFVIAISSFELTDNIFLNEPSRRRDGICRI
jgi:translation initiation factor RLI1